ncbi:hypothetical protein B6N60_02815 [Richelia sinica FACHB-800]|uniref:Uncharacterized protein n=1 Tax=Richelia sinica FACHB-800 TaxID=1357546 RepID=A0A975T8C4_9NOST|nr:hypothetical protein B6N60_02815 [Richelia sinica FACHB-800]
MWITLFLLFPLAIIGYLLHWGLTIWAIIRVFSNPDQPFRYPLIFRII